MSKPEFMKVRSSARCFRSLVSYSGIYRVEGDKWITKVDVSWTEAWTGTDQTRFFEIEGDKLEVTTVWLASPNLPGSPMTRGVLTWSRVRALRLEDHPRVPPVS